MIIHEETIATTGSSVLVIIAEDEEIYLNPMK